MTTLLRTAAIAVIAGILLVGCSAQPTPPTPDEAAAYCTESGGTVQSRQPTYGTNNDESAWVKFGEPIDVCRFQTVDDDASSRIYVDLMTLSSTQPTLAALAYLSKTPMPDAGGANPAAALCAELGGASGYGASANGGGLVNTSDPDDVVFVPCVFADQSFIEEWGIAYFTDGTVRGADLSKLFRFDAATAPDVF